jgi:hypothetical protein
MVRGQRTALPDFVLPYKINLPKTKTGCAVCAVGFLFLCAGAEKNKINSHQVSTYLSSKSLIIISCLFIQRVKISKLKFRSDTLAYNGHGYELWRLGDA